MCVFSYYYEALSNTLWLMTGSFAAVTDKKIISRSLLYTSPYFGWVMVYLMENNVGRVWLILTHETIKDYKLGNNMTHEIYQRNKTCVK